MTPVPAGEFEAVLAGGRLREAPANVGIGRELSFAAGPARQVVVHFGAEDSEQYLRDVTNRILALEDEWLLVPRRGTAGSLDLLPKESSASAIRFEASERSDLSLYLCTRSMDLRSASADLYAVAASGTILVTWDHHTAGEGLSIGLQRISDASRLISALNDCGAELEVFYAASEERQRDA
jgi:hypothetical protein